MGRPDLQTKETQLGKGLKRWQRRSESLKGAAKLSAVPPPKRSMRALKLELTDRWREMPN